ncbi:MAG: hypothetical protein EAZ55_09785 [Cytophagales bacterium]|nr:MAG: hypothetical protein EAZ55_09785 [Cytophagales bacterium]
MNHLQHLYQKYKNTRHLQWNIEEFILLLEFFPAMMVIMSDGIYDEEEKVYVNKLSQNMSLFLAQDDIRLYSSEDMQEKFKNELEYLANNIDDWKDEFLVVLHEHLQIHPQNKTLINDLIHLIAQVSQSVSNAEQSMIHYISERLAL